MVLVSLALLTKFTRYDPPGVGQPPEGASKVKDDDAAPSTELAIRMSVGSNPRFFQPNSMNYCPLVAIIEYRDLRHW